MKKVTIIIPCYNEEASLPILYEELVKLMTDSNLMDKYEWELLFINDGSKDNTLQILRELHKLNSCVNYVDLSRNFGKENAMLAGFDYATGDCVVIMDADLQHPPHLVKRMLSKWEEGYDDVYAKRISRGKESWLRRNLSLAFYAFLNKTSRVEMLSNVGDFRLLDRRCINALVTLRESERYTKGLYCWIGYKKTFVEFETKERIAGESSWSMMSLIKLAVDGLTSFTTIPLRIATIIGGGVSLIAFLCAIYFLVKTILFGDTVTGFPTLICVILFLGGIQLLCIGIVGEYIARMFNETKLRPIYFIREYNGELK